MDRALHLADAPAHIGGNRWEGRRMAYHSQDLHHVDDHQRQVEMGAAVVPGVRALAGAGQEELRHGPREEAARGFSQAQDVSIGEGADQRSEVRRARIGLLEKRTPCGLGIEIRIASLALERAVIGREQVAIEYLKRLEKSQNMDPKPAVHLEQAQRQPALFVLTERAENESRDEAAIDLKRFHRGDQDDPPRVFRPSAGLSVLCILQQIAEQFKTFSESVKEIWVEQDIGPKSLARQ